MNMLQVWDHIIERRDTSVFECSKRCNYSGSRGFLGCRPVGKETCLQLIHCRVKVDYDRLLVACWYTCPGRGTVLADKQNI